MLGKVISIAFFLVISGWIPIPLAQAGNGNGSLQETSSLDEPLQVLSQAQGIEGAYIGVAAARNPAYEPINRNFREILARGSNADLTKIKSEIANASPAGRLYLAALVQRLDKAEGDRLLNGMLADADAVTERSGCMMATFPVSYFAQELLRQGSVAVGLP